MEHVFSGVQLCIKISIFSDFLAICYIYHPTLGNSQLNVQLVLAVVISNISCLIHECAVWIHPCRTSAIANSCIIVQG